MRSPCFATCLPFIARLRFSFSPTKVKNEEPYSVIRIKHPKKQMNFIYKDKPRIAKARAAAL